MMFKNASNMGLLLLLFVLSVLLNTSPVLARSAP